MKERPGRLNSRARLVVVVVVAGVLYALPLSGCGKLAAVHGSLSRQGAARPAGDSDQVATARGCAARMRLTRRSPIAVGRGVGSLAVGDGAVWAARERAGTVTRLTGSARQVLNVGPTPLSLALGFGELWVGLRDADRVVSVDTRTLSLKRAANVPLPVSLLVGWDRVWVLSLDSQALYQLDPAGEISGEPIYSPVADPIGMAQAGGEVWLLGAHEGGLSPVNANLGRTVRAGFNLPGRLLGGLSSAGETIWLAEAARGALLRVDAPSATVAELPAPKNVKPSLTAVGRCGVWVASRTGTLELVDSQTGVALASPVSVGRSVAALASSGDGVWASDPLDGTVVYVGARRLR